MHFFARQREKIRQSSMSSRLLWPCLLAGGEVDLARRIAVGDLQQIADDALNARAQGVGLDILDQAVQADRHARQQLVGEGRVLVDELGDDGLTDMD